MHHGTTLTCHCEERSDVAISGRHSQIVQAAVKTYRPIASVAALPERHGGHWFGGTNSLPQCPQVCHSEERSDVGISQYHGG